MTSWTDAIRNRRDSAGLRWLDVFRGGTVDIAVEGWLLRLGAARQEAWRRPERRFMDVVEEDMD